MQELPALLGGKPVGTSFRIEGYRDTDGNVKNITVRTLGPNGYREMQTQALRILEGVQEPSLPGFEPAVARQALAALTESARKSLGAAPVERKEVYTDDTAGGFARKPGTDDAVYMLRLEVVDSAAVGGTPPTDPRRDLTRATRALAEELKLPTRRYLHAVKLTAGKFARVSMV